jgi:DNA-binding response OmpR family regulator
MLNPSVLACGSALSHSGVDAFRAAGYRVSTTRSGPVESFQGNRPDLVLLDADDLATDVHEVTRRLRALGTVPIIVVTRAYDEVSQLMAFASGADDVVASSTSTRVLLARVGAVLRRTVSGPTGAAQAREVGPFRLDPDTRQASVLGNDLDLTRIEFDLLGILLEQPTRVVPRDELVTRVWGSWFGDDHVVEVHLSRLRAKVCRAGGPRIGVAVRGVGYRLGLPTAVAV